MLYTNQQVSKLLKDYSDLLTAFGADKFKINAYRNASASIGNLPADIYHLWQTGELETIPGVGKGIASHLKELFSTGEISEIEEARQRAPKGMLELLALPGVGAKTAYRLTREAGIGSVDGLKKAVKQGKIARLSGFGEKSQERLAEAIKQAEKQKTDRFLLADVLPLGRRLVSFLRQSPSAKKVALLGSARRRSPTVGDLDIAVASNRPRQVIDHFVSNPLISRVVAQGERKATVILRSGLQVDLMIVPPRSWGSLLQHFTGSKQHNIRLRQLAKQQGWRLSEKVALAKEKDVYQKLGMQYIPPEMREDAGEVELALENKLPDLVGLTDIKGDLQTHSTYSDGIDTIERMAEKATSLSYRYLAITDHAPSPNTRSVREIKTWIDNRRREIARAQRKCPRCKILNGIEVNIPAQGGLALPNELLKMFDLVLVAIHTAFTKTSEEQTARIISALKNPYANIFAHPTGRVLLSRPAINADWETIFKVATQNKILLEVNAHPNRLDLPDNLIRQAKRQGAKFSLGTDAHSVAQLDQMVYGVYVARRGWLSASDIVNTGGLSALKSFLGKRGDSK